MPRERWHGETRESARAKQIASRDAYHVTIQVVAENVGDSVLSAIKLITRRLFTTSDSSLIPMRYVENGFCCYLWPS